MSMKTNLELSVVDQAPVRKGDRGGDALREAIELAREVERLGYKRTGWPSITTFRVSPQPVPRS